MEELRLVCDRNSVLQQKKIYHRAAAFRKSMQSIRTETRETIQNKARLEHLKSDLKQTEIELVKTSAVMSRKEARRMAASDANSSTKLRIEELQKMLKNNRKKKEEYNTFLSEQSHVLAILEEKSKRYNDWIREIEGATEWYRRVLGLRIESGHGVRFIFTNISLANPMKEYSFTIRHENNCYLLLDCIPALYNTDELVHELNKTNGLFQFVKIMRGKFKEIAESVKSMDADASVFCTCARVSSLSDNSSESPSVQNDLGILHRLIAEGSKIGDSPQPVRRSPRISLMRRGQS